MSCSYENNCPDEVIVRCLGCHPEILYCSKHGWQHWNDSNHQHQKLNEEEKLNYRLKAIKSKLKETELKVINETLAAIRALNSNMKTTLIEFKQINKSIKCLKDFNKILINENISKRIIKDSKDLFTLEKKNFQYLYDFKKDSNLLYCFNTVTEQFTKKIIKNLEPQGILSVLSQLSADTLFLYGGQNSVKYLDTAYLINLENSTCKSLSTGVARYRSTGEFVGNRVYVFGGSIGKLITDCNYFDIKSERWVQITNLPIASASTSTLSINKYILVTGYPNLISRFNMEENSHEILCNEITIRACNIVIPYKGKIILATYKGALVSTEDNLKRWTSINSANDSLFDYCTTSKPVIHGDNAYFIACGSATLSEYISTVLVFNCSTYSFRELLTMS